jgi:hypothetical protein
LEEAGVTVESDERFADAVLRNNVQAFTAGRQR